MSSTSSVCQVLKTALDEPRVLRLKLAPPGKPDDDVAGLSFLQCLDNYENATAAGKKPEEPYIHPLSNRPAPRLSDRSLAMCTESLGSESGGDSGDDNSLLSPEIRRQGRRSSGDAPIQSPGSDVTTRRPEIKKQGRRSSGGDITGDAPIHSPGSDVTFRRPAGRRSSGGSAAFPPPLTSAGSRVRPRREGGRLILTAESVSPAGSGLVSDRSDGRLRIRMLIEAQETETETECFGGEGQNGKECENVVVVGGESGNKGFLRGRRSRRCQGARAWEQDLGEPFWVAT